MTELLNIHSKIIGIYYNIQRVNMSVIKRDRNSSKTDLTQSIYKLCYLLEGQKEFEAVEDLKKAATLLSSNEPGSEDFVKGVEIVIDAFEGDHELMAYTFQRDTDKWTEVEELANQSSRVLTLARRFSPAK